MAIVYLGLGSNLGDRKENIARALSLLADHSINILQCSTIMETAPVGGPPGQDNFLNGVIKAETSLSPENLLISLKAIEVLLGRTKSIRNGPRIIDLDILLYDDLTVRTPHLTIPHPRMHSREFVMIPLTELEPKLAKKISHACN